MIHIEQVHNFDCEVLIAGGGPAGSSLAYHLADHGIDTIVIEQKEFPRDKICGDGISPVAMKELESMGICAIEPEFHEYNEINKVALYVEDKEVLVNLTKNQYPRGRVIPRYVFDNWIYAAAKRKGAHFMENARIINYQKSRGYIQATITSVDGQTKKLKAKVIVGADGSNSTIARLMHGIKAKNEYLLLGLRAYYKNTAGPTDRCDFYFSKSNFPGIFWFFPIGADKGNVGSAMIASTIPQNTTHSKSILLNELKENKHFANRIGEGQISEKISGWPLAFKDPNKHVVEERLILIGDAAGLINPLSGDGIQYALLSGRWAADFLKKCSSKNDYSLERLYSFEQFLHKETAYDIALSSLLVQISRNRALTSVWLEILSMLFERAKYDESYANIITGIFDGSHPSYKALNASFILKSLLSGILSITSASSNIINKDPNTWADQVGCMHQLPLELIMHVNKNPSGYLGWLFETFKGVLSVGKHTFREKFKVD